MIFSQTKCQNSFGELLIYGEAETPCRVYSGLFGQNEVVSAAVGSQPNGFVISQLSPSCS